MAVPNRKRAPRQLTIKVLVLGERNVGKSATIVRFLTHRFIGHYGSSKDWIYKQPIAYDAKKNMTTSVELQEQTLQYYDNYDDSSSNANAVLRAKMLWADAFIVIYAINDRNSFDRAKYYLKFINNTMNLNEQLTETSTKTCYNDATMQLLTQIKRPILLLANKSDLSRDGRQVLSFEGHSLAALHRCLFSEISAAESHIGICNTFKALLIQANSLPSQSTSSFKSDHNNQHHINNNTGHSMADNNNISNQTIKISTKLNNNLHDRYDSIKSSFRRASLAIVSSKTFVNHHKKHHHTKQATATTLLSSNSEYSSGDLLQSTDNNNSHNSNSNSNNSSGNNNRCFSIGAIGDTEKQQEQQMIADNNGSLDKLSRGRNKRRGLFKYKQRRTTITVTGHLLATTDERIHKEQQQLIVAPKEHMATTVEVAELVRRHKSYSLKQHADNNKHNRQCSSTSDVLDDDSHDDKLENSLDLSDHSQNTHSKLLHLSSDSTNLTTNDSNERSLSRGSCSSCKSTDGIGSGSRRNVSKLLSIMFNRPSSVIDTTTNHCGNNNNSNQLYNSISPIHSKSVPLYQIIPQAANSNSQLHNINGDSIKIFNASPNHSSNNNNNSDQDDDQDDKSSNEPASAMEATITNTQKRIPIELVPFTSIRNFPKSSMCQSSSQFHQASCARQLAPTLNRRNRRWYRLIGH